MMLHHGQLRDNNVEIALAGTAQCFPSDNDPTSVE